MKKAFTITLIALALNGFSQIKLSNLTEATTLDPTDMFLITQSGVSKKAPYSLFPSQTGISEEISDSLDYYVSKNFQNDTLEHYSLSIDIGEEINDSLDNYTPLAAGSEGAIQFNNGGVLAGSDSLRFSMSGNRLYGSSSNTYQRFADTAILYRASYGFSAYSRMDFTYRSFGVSSVPYDVSLFECDFIDETLALNGTATISDAMTVGDAPLGNYLTYDPSDGSGLEIYHQDSDGSDFTVDLKGGEGSIAVSTGANNSSIDFYEDSIKLELGGASGNTSLIIGDEFIKTRGAESVIIEGNLTADTIMNYISEETLVGDEGINIKGELHVGMYNGGKESVFGEGDSHVNGLKVLSTTNDITYTDNTAAASSGSGSTYTVFNGTTTIGSTDYFGSDYPICGVKLNTASLTDPGTGSVAREYWDGTTWVSFTAMATNSDFPYDSRADNIGTVVGSEQVRFGSCDNQDTTTINGVHGKYWFRFRVSSPIISCGTVEQVKLHTNRYEINADGKTEYFGSGIYDKDIELNLSTLSGATPSSESISFASDLTLNFTGNGFNNSATDGYGGFVLIPEGLDSSKPLEFTATYYVDGTMTGDVEFQFEFVEISLTDTLDGTLPYQAQLSDIKTISVASDKVLKTVTFEINAEDLIPGEGFSFKFYRDATVSNADDTLAGNIVVLSNRLIGKFWQP